MEVVASDYYNKIFYDMKYELMSNAELRVALVEMEHEYEALKEKIKNEVNRMNILDEEYIKIRQLLQNRTKGVI
mgnify:CR=1 FL=1